MIEKVWIERAITMNCDVVADFVDKLLEFFSPPAISDTSVHEVYPGLYVQFLNAGLSQAMPASRGELASSSSKGKR